MHRVQSAITILYCVLNKNGPCLVLHGFFRKVRHSLREISAGVRCQERLDLYMSCEDLLRNLILNKSV